MDLSKSEDAEPVMMLGGQSIAEIEPGQGALAESGTRPKILFLINSLARGGAERVMATLLTNSGKWAARYEIALAVLDDDGTAFAMPEWLQIFQLDCRRRTFRSIRAVDEIVATYDPDLTMSFLTRANIASGIAMMKRNRHWIISERTSTSAHLGNGVRQLMTKAMIRLVYPRASRVVAVSAGVAGKLSKGFAVLPEKIAVIPNPVDLTAIEAAAREPSAIAAEKPYVIALGRLVRVKNYRLLIEAFARAQLPVRLVIAGDGPERHALEACAKALGIDERVVMPGWLSNPYPALAGARLFALSSNIEGFPNALVEALALGVPAVATDCSDALPEILAGSAVERGSGMAIADAGILTPVGDVEAFAAALRVAFDEDTGTRLAAAARERAVHYSAKAGAARYWEVIEQELVRAAAARAA